MYRVFFFYTTVVAIRKKFKCINYCSIKGSFHEGYSGRPRNVWTKKERDALDEIGWNQRFRFHIKKILVVRNPTYPSVDETTFERGSIDLRLFSTFLLLSVAGKNCSDQTHTSSLFIGHNRPEKKTKQEHNITKNHVTLKSLATITHGRAAWCNITRDHLSLKDLRNNNRCR